MTRRSQSIVFAALISGLSLGAFLLSWRLGSAERLGPVLVSGFASALSLVQLGRELKSPREAAPSQESRDVMGLGWALVLLPGILLLGCMPAMALHTLLFVRFRGGRSWRMAALCATLAALPVYVIAKTMLRPELLSGVLWN